MTEEIQQRPQEEPQQAPAAALPLAPKRLPRAPSRRRTTAKARKPKLMKFDAVLLQLLKEGKSDAAEIRGIFNVDGAEFNRRVTTLLKRRLIVADAEMRNLHLSVQGVNEYRPEWRRHADQWLGREEKKPVAQPGPVAAEAPAPIEIPGTAQAKLEIAAKPEPAAGERVEKLDLEDVIRKYGPNESQKRSNNKTSPFLAGRTGRAAPAKRPENRRPDEFQSLPYEKKAAEEKRTPAMKGNGEQCELCKAGFAVSVKKEDNNPKYGHCFCGAAYHKDCFEAILEGEKKCVRCGRKLALSLDVKAEEAVSGIKDISG
ncbi:MAG: hypothetical protein V1787_01110 [Candidatus Micrarchaeota archaeon]